MYIYEDYVKKFSYDQVIKFVADENRNFKILDSIEAGGCFPAWSYLGGNSRQMSWSQGDEPAIWFASALTPTPAVPKENNAIPKILANNLRFKGGHHLSFICESLYLIIIVMTSKKTKNSDIIN